MKPIGRDRMLLDAITTSAIYGPGTVDVFGVDCSPSEAIDRLDLGDAAVRAGWAHEGDVWTLPGGAS